jgi:hypothetical protein
MVKDFWFQNVYFEPKNRLKRLFFIPKTVFVDPLLAYPLFTFVKVQRYDFMRFDTFNGINAQNRASYSLS